MDRASSDTNDNKELATASIIDTRWMLIDRAKPGLFSDEKMSQILKAATILTLFLGFGLGVMSLFRSEEYTSGRTRKTFLGIEADQRGIAMDMHDEVLSGITHLARQCTLMRESVVDPVLIKRHLDNSETTLEEIAHLNPIEMAFSQLIAHLRKAAAKTYGDLWPAIGNICNLFEQKECWNFLHNAGYASG